MISKDGKYLAARDMSLDPPTTRIFRLTNEGKCEEVKDLGLPTGKADFSFDGNYLTFHAATDSVEGTDYFSVPEQTQDVMVYNIATEEIQKITNNQAGQTSYYPVWNRNGEIVYIDRNRDGDFSFVVADPNQVKDFSIGTNEDFLCETTKNNSLSILGGIWSQVCLKMSRPNRKNRILTALSLTAEKCERLIDLHWNKITKKIRKKNLEIGKEDLLAACPTTRVETVEPASNQPVVHSPEQIIQTKCNICHQDITRNLSRATSSPNSKVKNWKEEAIRRISSNDEVDKMPKGSEISSQDKQALIEYLRTQ